MEKVKFPDFKIKIEYTDVTEDLRKYVSSISYTDNISLSDSLEITLDNRDGRFFKDWFPGRGTLISLKLGYRDNLIDCGTFRIAELVFSGFPQTATLYASTWTIMEEHISIFKEKKTRVWENTTLSKVVEDIAREHGFQPLIRLSEDIEIERIEQNNITSFKFVAELAEKFDCTFKIYKEKLVFISWKYLEDQHPLMKISPENTVRYRIKDVPREVYKKAVVQYYDPKTKELREYIHEDRYMEFGGVYKVQERAENLKQAIVMAKSALRTGNVSKVKPLITLEGNPSVVAGLNTIKFGNTLTLTASGAKTAFRDEGAKIVEYEWLLPSGIIYPVSADPTTEQGTLTYNIPNDPSLVGRTLIFRVRAKDSFGNVSPWTTHAVKIAGNTPPQLNGITWYESDGITQATSFYSGRTYILEINASDIDGDTLTYSVNSSDANVSITQDTTNPNRFHVTFPVYQQDTQVTLTITVSDGKESVSMTDTRNVIGDTTLIVDVFGDGSGYELYRCETYSLVTDGGWYQYVTTPGLAGTSEQVEIYTGLASIVQGLRDNALKVNVVNDGTAPYEIRLSFPKAWTYYPFKEATIVLHIYHAGNFNEFSFQSNNANGAYVSGSLTDWQNTLPSAYTWHQYAFAVNQTTGTAKLYVDGNLVFTLSPSPIGTPSNESQFLITLYSNSSADYVILDTVRIFNRELTATEIQQLYQTEGV